ncbi:MAG: NAD(P)H-binding protein, partial [Planctomycetota bacterium]|nr:NAD(P)H-binding protein [Planctomycetota bacterium]
YYTLFTIPVILPFYFWDKARQERLIADNDRDWVLVRPGVLTNGARRGGCRHGRKLGSFVATVRIPRADVAAFMLDQLTADDYLRAAVGIAA